MPGKIAVITGPTATGKTELGIILARELNGEVVSADSMQIYRGMDIGTAKPTAEEQSRCRHHMIDVAEPGENWSCARYAEEAARCVDDILARGRLPVVVGGTGLYIDALISGRSFADAPGDSGLRERLAAEYDARGGAGFREYVASFDPARAARLAPGDRKRLIRAAEVYLLTGETITSHDERTGALPPRYDAAKIALSFRDRADLYDRIDRRVDRMLAMGLRAEVEQLLERGLTAGSTAMQAIGYKEMARAVSGELDVQAAAEQIKRESRRYAKRQLTWLRRDSSVFWIEWDKIPDFDWARRVSTAFLAGRGIK